MGITGTTIRSALSACGAVGKQIRGFDELATGADGALRAAPPGLTAAGAAAFLATCEVESAWFRTTVEYGSGQRYAPYVGRSFVQLTWKENYRGFGRWCQAKGLVTDPECFVGDPRSLGDLRWAWLGAVYYFGVHDLWRYANPGNFRAVSQAVNGGDGKVGTAFVPHGWKERQQAYAVFLRIGDALLPDGTPPPSSSGWDPATMPGLAEGDVSDLIWWLQRWMNDHFPTYSNITCGEHPPSRLGPQSVATFSEWQRRCQITPADPFAWGPKSWAKAKELGFPG